MPNISLHFEKSIAYLVFSKDGDNAGVLGARTLAELSERLDELSCHAVDGLIVFPYFIGSDLAELATANPKESSQLIATGQSIFNRISDMEFPTVAAINGPCIGGGFELALACDWRIGSNESDTEISLPEVSQGILPAWGGTTRLPELLGLPDSLPVLLSSQSYSVERAREKGLIDEISHIEQLADRALDFIDKGKRHHTHNPIVHNQAVATLTKKQFLKELQKRKTEHTASIEAALEVAVTSIGRTRVQSQQAELEALQSLLKLPTTRNLLRFSANKRSHQLSIRPHGFNHAAVIGASPNGCDIAGILSLAEIQTILREDSIETLAQAMQTISDSFSTSVKASRISQIQSDRSLDRIHPAESPVSLLRSDLVIVTSADEKSPSEINPKAIIATHSAALPISPNSQYFENPERHLGLHFPNFLPNCPVVEVIRTDFTSTESLNAITALVHSIGKIPVIVHDSPGFVISRLLISYLSAASDLFKNGADPEDIDDAMLEFGMTIGPLHLIDLIGLQTVLEHAKILHQAFPDRIPIPETVVELLSAGNQGSNTGSGFFVYDTPFPAVNAEVIGFQTGTDDTPKNTAEILSGIIIREAELCLAEGLVATREEIDLLMVLGTGFPPFRSTSLHLR
ncbi:enoyl-CoA hydratase-related protein [Luteolibacter sp. AS25]|uniref:enoyl-CoA hydratase-related protein n=1 Tax=Luteolibacter sp. AS25 TaxID=3135776 RepID=UPI00398AB1F2